MIDKSTTPITRIHLFIEPNREQGQGEMNLVFSPTRRLLGADDSVAKIERVKATEAAKSKDHGSQLLGTAANISQVARADQLPETLVSRGFVPLLVDAGRRG